MAYLILGMALLAGVLLAGQWYVHADPKTLVKALKWCLIGLIVAVTVFFLMTGRFALALAALPALLPWLFRLHRVVQTLRVIRRMAQQMGGGSSQANRGRASTSNMSRREALEILGLEEHADEDAVHEAHRRLIANLHPDKGGSTYLAAKINQAKDVLLKT